VGEVASPPRSERFARAGFHGRASYEEGESPSYDDLDQRPEWDEDGAQAARPGAPRTSWKKGQHIIHTQFGRGEVLEVEGHGTQAKLRIAFERGGTRQLHLRWAGKDLRLAD